ncbi:signal peptidase II [Bacillus sp. FJAT-27264]|uniref:signal peptidase II n=1 Tax=Paenibacillus sp. (strain DSM 101736 / FJAT-27264) TaxID=1850362 RepID=UPI0008080C9B|nr:signal peptidase II [Bacillus sp. FJAT-27264]OBZ18643.1 signal peptidase II [Bacillus sp. FJAT-27264]
MIFYLISALVILVDQVSKWLVRTHMEVGETIPFWAHLLKFTFYENSGAAFSSFQGFGRYFVIVAVGFVVAIFYYRRKGEISGHLLNAAAGFLVGGAIGNAIDRVLFNKVTDFLVFGHSNGILNIADVAINAGVVLVLCYMIVGQLKRII